MKKYAIKNYLILALLALVIPCLPGVIGNAQADVAKASFGIDSCTVQASSSDLKVQMYSLQSALSAYNAKNPLLRLCNKQITIQSNTTLGAPIVISGANSSNTGLTIEGKKPDGKPVVLDASGITSAYECAVTVNSQHVTLKNLIVVNAKKGNGICIKQPDTVLDNVRVRSSAGFGIKIDKVGSASTVIQNQSGAYRNTLGGIQIDTDPNDPHTTFTTIDPKLVLFGNSGTELEILNEDDTKVCLVGSTVSTSAPALQGTVFIDGKKQVPYMMVIYSGNPSNYIVPSTDEEKPLNFNEIIAGYLLSEDAAKELDGLGLTDKNKGTFFPGGGFLVSLDKNSQQSDMTILLYTKKGVIGGKAVIFNISTGNGKFDLCSGDSATPVDPNNPGSIPGSGSGSKAFLSKQECINSKGGLLGVNGQIADVTYDSDHDGIPDYIEDSNNNCDCNDGDRTCWYKADTDGDGILDGTEDRMDTSVGALWGVTDCKDKEGKFVRPKNEDLSFPGSNKQLQPLINESSGFFFPGTRIPTVCVDPASNSTGIKTAAGFAILESSPSMTDSDLDTKLDMYEARHNGWLDVVDGKNFPRTYLTTLDGNPIIDVKAQDYDISSQTVGCTLDNSSRAAGISYGFYAKRTANIDGKETVQYFPAFDQSVTATERATLQFLTCRSETVMSTDYVLNGVVDPDLNKGETDLRRPDTDNDGLSDGVDQCPAITKDITCKAECYDKQIFWILPLKYRTADGQALKKDADGVPLIFSASVADIAKYSKDFDGDGIPSILEMAGSIAPTGLCQDMGKGDTMNPYVLDSDGDGKQDNNDACPTDKSNTCNTQQTYKNYPMLSCFIDRDVDGLVDGREDINLNGIYEIHVTGKDICTGEDHIFGETNADSSNSDAGTDDLQNKLTDYIEVTVLHTDPNHADTDSDGLSDFVEVNRDNNPTGALNIGRSDNKCIIGLATQGDTDPLKKDTDGDGINDNIEVALQINPTNADSDGDGLCDGSIDVTNGVFGNCKAGEVYNAVAGGYPQVSNIPGKDLKNPSDLLVILTEMAKGTPTSSDPCNDDTDYDGRPDAQDPAKKNPGAGAQAPSDIFGNDYDLDGLPDDVEIAIGTNLTKFDSDNDGLPDGCVKIATPEEKGELCTSIRNKSFSDLSKNTRYHKGAGMGETDPMEADTDKDGMPDGYEMSYPDGQYRAAERDKDGKFIRFMGLNPITADTDGDGVLDGVEDGGICSASPASCCGTDGIGKISWNGDGVLQAGQETDAMNKDSDGDTLLDGHYNGQDQNGEDLNCNGIVDKDKNGNFSEANPRMSDSNLDGVPDNQAFCFNGICGNQNIGRVYGKAAGGGCNNTLIPTAGATPADLVTLAMLLSPLAAAVRMRFRRKQ